ncbi:MULTISPECIES: DUF4129 domain-containing protein [unclassified Corallococcus]|uniref:DUF4129 domain-containing protein n=1 Tax=unclassified Corallococcus TaxID=2685029 RepID=UPI001A8FB9B1|nr:MULTISPECIES: DUF4129 domain-containing protein [unclassified Corallococcus]MBN9683799.1 DUF4129 domain-containing protein [Corallococcus sp. NCSPR001]WAS84700.1 DUF4129 domain-containing protein [Corallococcus sp. NCRR]
MAVSALELRPRGPVALMDAALRLCARDAGVWALTLPGGAAVVAALLHLLDAVDHGRSPTLPALYVTLAWFLRGVGQGAACHYVQELLLGAKAEPSVRQSLRAALEKLPSLFIAVAYLALFNVLTLTFSLGIALFLLSAQGVGYAATMQGRGSPLKLYAVGSRLLGPSRGTATAVRWLMGVQVLVFLNLHVGLNFLLYLGRKLVGVDLTFAERFASLDNPPWLVFLAATTFALFEPLRAATATLLLVDGRVRQEGLDLLAAVQQLPERSTQRGGLASKGVAAALLLATGLLLAAPAPVEAAAPVERQALRERLEKVATECELPEQVEGTALRDFDALNARETVKLERFVRRLEQQAFDDEDCETAAVTLENGLAQVTATAEAQARADARAATDRARAILARPEFQERPEKAPGEPKEEEVPPPESSWWRRFIDKLGEWLRDFFKRNNPRPQSRETALPVSGGAAANVLVVMLVALTLAVLGVVLVSVLRRKRGDSGPALEVSTVDAAALAGNPDHALSRPPEGWAHLADALAAKGEYREAVRNLYLALLSRLHRDGAIHYDETLSNWDYLRAFRGRPEVKAPFRELTRRFDFAWYGNVPVSADGYTEFRAITAPLLAAPPAQEAAGA